MMSTARPPSYPHLSHQFSQDPPPTHYGKSDDSPPDSPGYRSSPPSFSDQDCSTSVSSSETGNGPQGTSSSGAPAKEAVCLMGIPEHLVQLAIDVQRLDYGTDFTKATDLFVAADAICQSPEMQAELAMKLHLAEQAEKQKKAEEKQKDASPLKPENSQLYLLSVSKDSARLSAEMPQAAGLEQASEHRAKLQEKVQSLAKENQQLRKRKMCRACRKVELATSGITFLPCGHFITCEACSEMFDDCPACGKNIMGTVRTFLS